MIITALGLSDSFATGALALAVSVSAASAAASVFVMMLRPLQLSMRYDTIFCRSAKHETCLLPAGALRAGASQVNLLQYFPVKTQFHRSRPGARISAMRHSAGRDAPIAPPPSRASAHCGRQHLNARGLSPLERSPLERVGWRSPRRNGTAPRHGRRAARARRGARVSR